MKRNRSQIVESDRDILINDKFLYSVARLNSDAINEYNPE